MAISPTSVLPAHARKSVLWGAVSAVVIMVTSGMRGWPFPSLTAEPWLFQFNGTNTAVKYSVLAAFYLGCAGLCASWVSILRKTKAGTISTKTVWFAFALWSFILFFATPLFSGDVFVYYVDGEIVRRGFDPYATGVSGMGPVPHVHMVHMLWRDTTTMYGPIFIRMVQGITYASQGNLIAGVLMLRAIAIASVAVAGYSLQSLARRFGRNEADGVAFALLNPVTMLHLVGGAHNDSAMLGLLAAGLAIGFASQKWPLRLVALALCAAAGAFKIPGFAGALVLGWAWTGVDVNRWKRVVGAAVAGTVALLWFEVQTLATGLSWGWIKASNVPGLAHPLLSIPNAVALSFGSLIGEGYPFNDLTRPAALGIAALVATWLLVRTGRAASPYKMIRAFGWALLIIAWTGPAVYPWYLGWGIALIGAMGASKMRTPLIVATCAVIFLIAPGGYGVLDIPYGSWRTVVAFITFSVMAYGIFEAFRRNNIQLILPKLARKSASSGAVGSSDPSPDVASLRA